MELYALTTKEVNLEAPDFAADIDLKIKNNIPVLLVVWLQWTGIDNANVVVEVQQRPNKDFEYLTEDTTEHKKTLTIGAGKDRIKLMGIAPGDVNIHITKPAGAKGIIKLCFTTKE